MLPVSSEHHLTPTLPHFVAERETKSRGIGPELLTFVIFSTEQFRASLRRLLLF